MVDLSQHFVLFVRDKLGKHDCCFFVDDPLSVLLRTVFPGSRYFKRCEAFFVSHRYLIIRTNLDDSVEVSDSVVHIVEGNMTPTALVERKRALVDVVGVGEGFRGIFVTTSRHQQIARINVHHRVLGF